MAQKNNGLLEDEVVMLNKLKGPTNPMVTPLLTDLYQFTMAYAYWKNAKHLERAVFDLFFRKNPFGGEYTIFAGLEECIRFIANFKFTEEEISYLRSSLPTCEDGFFDYLRGIDCSDVEVYAVSEGTVVFPKMPLLRVEGPVALVQLLETPFVNLINYASLVATNASRHRFVAGKSKMLLEFGLRRAQGPDGGISASKYCYLGGFDATRINGIVDCGERHKHIYERAMLLVEQVKVSKGSPLVSCLLEGPSGSGKSALAATVGIDSNFAYVKIISAETMIGLSESSKCAQIVKVFEDAYKSQLSIVILDDIERLLEYVAIGPRFSNLISQTMMVLLKRFPPKGKNMLVIGTTSEVGFLESLGICDAFSITYNVPTLQTVDAKKVLDQLNVFAEDDVDTAAEALKDIPIKKLYTLIEMAVQGEKGGAAEAIYSGEEKININHFYDCLNDIIR